MKATIEIPDQTIIDIMVTALEGGSNFWYYLPELDMVDSAFADYNPEKEGYLSTSEKVVIAALNKGAVVPVYDIEDDTEKLGEISLANFERGINLFIQQGRPLDPCIDASEADNFMQLVVMGEIIYG